MRSERLTQELERLRQAIAYEADSPNSALEYYWYLHGKYQALNQVDNGDFD